MCIRDSFEPDETYLLSTHRNADGDGLGALLALAGMLDHLNRQCRIIICDDQPDPRFSFLGGFDRIESCSSQQGRPAFDRVVFVDTPTYDIRRVGDVALMLAKEAEGGKGGDGPVIASASESLENNAPAVSVHAVRVKVERETGVGTPLQYIAVQDVGFAINPMLIEGQMHGGVLQGLGWARPTGGFID